MSDVKKARLPRNKPIDYTIMRYAPFYDGMLTDDERNKVRNDKELYECVKTAHYTRGLYVGGVNPEGTYVCMVTAEGLPMMGIRRRSDHFELSHGYWPDDRYPHQSVSGKHKKLSQAVSTIAHGIRRRSGTSDPFDYEVPRVAAMFTDMCHGLRRRYSIEKNWVNLSADATTWAALCATGRVSQVDVPTSVMNEIVNGAAKYNKHVEEVDNVLSQLREGLCRKKWVVGAQVFDRSNIRHTSIIVGRADMTPLFDAVREATLREMNFSHRVNINFDIPLRLYRSFDALPEEFKSNIAPRMIALNVREGRPQSEWATSLFPLVDGTFYRDEIETLTMGSNQRINWYVVNA